MKHKNHILTNIIILFLFFILIYIATDFYTHSLETSNNKLNIHLYIDIFTFIVLFSMIIILIYKNMKHKHEVRKKSLKNELKISSKIEKKIQERTHDLVELNTQLKQEILERKTVEHQLNINKEHLIRLAHYDPLTSLPNRVFFNEILNKAIEYSKINNKIFAILFIDLDNFKKINDIYGHATGDKTLIETGNRFAEVLRTGDILARLGGDEYIVLLRNISHPKHASTVAEKIIKSSAQSLNIDSHEFFISASIGISIFPNDGNSLEDLQKHADMAMYKAKHVGGGIYQYYTQDMNIAALENSKLETALRKAIVNNEFILHFQPTLNLSDGTIKSAEALIRWEHPELGLVSPAKFIPIAEETGLIMPIGEWALNEACRINKELQNQGYEPITIAVNMSPKQFRHQDVVQVVVDAIQKHHLESQYLKIEITESAVMENVENTIKKLNSVRDMGVQISIDDFGTGYTSISYLRQYPVSVLKIDQTFIKGLPENPNDVAITSAVIALGHNLGLEVIAEGVETAEQMQFLSDHGCDSIQGYFFSRPVPASKLASLLTKKIEVEKA